MEDVNPTGLEIELSRLIDAAEFLPNVSQSNAILAVVDEIPCVLFCVDGHTWETESGETPVFEAWVYLKG